MKEIKPLVAWLTTNRTCNNKCKWCYTYNYKCSNLKMNNEKLKDTVDVLAENGIKKIILIGGEPTINNDIIDIIKYINKKNIIVSIASNGRRFSDISFTQKCKEAGLNFANISLKGINEEQYIENTNSIGFFETIQGYNNIKNSNIDSIVSYVITKNDSKEFYDLKEVLLKNNINSILLLLYKPSINTSSNDKGPSINEFAEACKTIYYIFNNSGINVKFEMSIPLCLFEKEFLNTLINNNMISTCCHITKGNGIVFDTDFNILPCNHFVDNPLNEHPISTENIIDFWNSKTCVDFRNTIRKYPSKKCINCEKWNICGGGCLLRWLSEKPENIISGFNERM